MASIIFSGDRLRALRQAIQLNTAGATIASGTVDPTVSAPGISLSPGSLYLSTSTGKLYIKKTSTGDDTNFDTIPQLAATLTANRVVITDSTGAIVTDAELTYDATTDTLTVENVNVSGLTASLPVKTDASKNLVSAQIVNADVDAAAAIALTKLATVTADRALHSNGSGVIAPSIVTAVELARLTGVTSDVQTQLDDKVNKAGDSMTGDLVMGGNKVTSLGAPTAGTDAANKAYVDNLITGLAWKDPVRAVSTTDITLSAPQTVDGVSVIAGNRVLVAGQTDPIENGIYVVAAGSWTRSSDMAAASSASSDAVFVQEGTVYADTGWTCTTNSGSDVVGTDSLTFTQFTGAGSITAGVGLSKTGNTLDVNLGAGIVQLPTDEVGIDLYSASGLMLTEDGTTPSTDTDAQLAVRLDGSTIARSASGIKVADDSITNTQINSAAAIAYSKLNLSNSVVNADIAAAAAIAYSKLDLANSIVDADISTSAAIARDKLAAGTVNRLAYNDGTTGELSDLAAITASRAVASNANGLPVAATTTAAELDYVSGVTSSIQTQIDNKVSKAGDSMTGALDMGDNKITSLGAPTLDDDAATKEYVDNAVSPDFNDSTFRISDNGDSTKKIAFEASGIATGTVRTITMPDSNVDLGLVATAIQRDGSVAFTANQPMGSNKLTGLAAGTSAGDSVRYEQTILVSGANAFTANQSMGGFKLTNLAAGTSLGDSVRYEQVILTDGTNTFTADQSMGSFKLTNLGTPTTSTDAATKEYVDAGDSTGTTNLTLTAGQTISTATNTYTHQVINVQANGSGVTVLSSTPFGTGSFKNGQIITLMGNSATNIVQIDNNDASKGCIMNASWTGALYDSITFVYSSTTDRFVEVSRNN